MPVRIFQSPPAAPLQDPEPTKTDLELATSNYDAATQTLTVEAPRSENLETPNYENSRDLAEALSFVPVANQVFIKQEGDLIKITVRAGDEERTFEQHGVKKLVIRTGDGNDLITTGALKEPESPYDDKLAASERAYGDGSVNIDLEVHAGGGNDDVIGSLNGRNVLYGQGGGDRLIGGNKEDIMEGAAGDDYLEGCDANDRLDGKEGNDVLYGGRGNDQLYDNSGALNYFEGGKGNDYISAESVGDNVISGGRGNDTIFGLGNDTVYTGLGKDHVYNVSGKDKVFSQEEDDIETEWAGEPRETEIIKTEIKEKFEIFGLFDWSTELGADSIVYEGTGEFVDRMQDDIDMYRASPTGQKMLQTFDDIHDDKDRVVKIAEGRRSYLGDDFKVEGDHEGADRPQIELNLDGTPAEGRNPTARIYPASIGQRELFGEDPMKSPMNAVWLPPAIGLYHEMAHAYNRATGTMQRGDPTETGTTYDGTDGNDIGIENSERQAVGLDNSGMPYDFDNNPDTPKTTANPRELTENGIRAEMRIPLRPFYTGPNDYVKRPTGK